MLTAVRTGDASVAEADPAALPVPRADVIVLAVIVALGAVLRLVTIAHQSYWVDEATTAHELSLSFGGLMHAVHVTESTPPLYYVLAWLWAKVFGTGAVALRSLSALAGIAFIPVAWACGREFVSRGAGLVLALLTAVNPFLIWYSQEARAYMLFALWCGLSLLYFGRAERRGERRDLVAWTAVSVLALLTHFFAGFLVAPEALWLLWRRRDRPALGAVAAVAIVQIALLPLSLSDHSSRLDWIDVFPLGVRIRQVPVDFALSTLYQSPAVTYGLIGAAVCALVAIALLVLGGGPRRRRGAAVAAGVGAFAVLVPILLAAAGTDYLVARNLIAAWLPIALVLAAAATAPRTLPFGVVLTALAVGAFVYAGFKINATPQYERPDWRGVAHALGTPSGRRAIVAYDSSYATAPLSLYLAHVPWAQAITAPVRVSEVDVVANAYSTPAARLPTGARRLSVATVGTFLVARYAVSGWSGTPAQLGARATALVPGGAQPAVLIQPG